MEVENIDQKEEIKKLEIVRKRENKWENWNRFEWESQDLKMKEKMEQTS